jgi:hypothetical protein
VDEVALIRDTISHYAPVLIASLSIPNSSHRWPEKIRGAAGSRYLETLDREVRAAVANGLSLEDTLKVATAEAYSGYKLYPWTHKQINVPHAYRRIKGLE